MKRSSIVSAISILLGASFIFFAVLKIASPSSTIAAMRYLFEVPLGVYEAILIVIVAFELALGYALVVRWKLRTTMLASLLLLAMFSAVLVEFLRDPSAPSCGCAGAFQFTEDDRIANWASLGRNGVMIALAYGGYLFAAPMGGSKNSAHEERI